MIEKAPGGWFIEHNGAYFHLTPEWLDEMYRHQIRPRQAEVDGRIVPAEGEAEFHRLRYLVLSGDAQLIEEAFAEAYGAIVANRQLRNYLGLKPVTTDGDEDLRAVREGAPVKPWNSAHKKSALHDWIRGRRANRE